MRRARAALVAAALLTSGCTVAGGEPAVQDAVEEFATAVGDGDGARACALLAPLTRRALEDDSGAPCAEAVLAVELPDARSGVEVQRYGRTGRVVLGAPDGERDRVFVALFDRTWLVTAAGCTPRGDLPHDCEIEGP